jgi:hypothetical protein
LKGYFVLNSDGTPPPLDIFHGEPPTSGNHISARGRGNWSLSPFPELTVSIPSRDKQVEIRSPVASQLYQRVSVLDSSPGPTYRSKLLDLLGYMDDLVCEGPRIAVLNNISTSTHGSLALLGDFVYFGLHDPQANVSYLMWTTEPGDLPMLQARYPLRYLVYRFPQIPVVFLAGESVCSKWWRWTKSAPLLHAFNALEMRLSNGSSG